MWRVGGHHSHLQPAHQQGPGLPDGPRRGRGDGGCVPHPHGAQHPHAPPHRLRRRLAVHLGRGRGVDMPEDLQGAHQGGDGRGGAPLRPRRAFHLQGRYAAHLGPGEGPQHVRHQAAAGRGGHHLQPQRRRVRATGRGRAQHAQRGGRVQHRAGHAEPRAPGAVPRFPRGGRAADRVRRRLAACLEHPGEWVYGRESRRRCWPAHTEQGKVGNTAGCEVEQIRLESGRKPDEAEILTIPEAHGSRIRGLAVAPQSSASDASSSIQASKSPSTAHALPRLVGTASSDGTLRLWNLEDIRAGAGGAAPQPLAEVDTRARLTCLTAMLSPTELAAQHAAEREAMKAAAALRKAKKRRTEPEAGEAGEGTRATKATKARKTKEAEELRGGAEAPAPQHDRTSKGNKEEGKSAGPRKGPRAGSESEAAARPDRRPGQAPRPVLPARPGVVDFVSDADLLAQRSKRQSMQARVARGRKAAHRPIGPAAP
uniref:Uncharacterized protein n=1 Tax=Auxenochlorella protothecoides TaxID=3075 RepID=A0A1D2A1R1_AUXPR